MLPVDAPLRMLPDVADEARLQRIVAIRYRAGAVGMLPKLLVARLQDRNFVDSGEAAGGYWLGFPALGSASWVIRRSPTLSW